MELYWVWANDKKVRNNAINKEQYLGQPRRVVQSSLANKTAHYIFLADKKPIGQVRLKKKKLCTN